MCLFFISVLSFLTYGYAIGRSDGGHIKSTFGYVIIFYALLLIYFLLNLFSNFIKKNRYYDYVLIFSIFLIFYNNINFNNIYNYKSRLNEYVQQNDKYFLTTKQSKFLDNAQNLLIKNKCIQNLSNDALFLYLLRKVSCTKFYFPITVGSDKNQNLLINKLKNVKIILLDSDDKKFSPMFKLKLLKKFIDQNYEKIYEEDKWIILESKQL